MVKNIYYYYYVFVFIYVGILGEPRACVSRDS